ncbi:aromatic-ring-hydroxylating dioxygenase subunit beta, partial [Escherichia coli]|uniref:aromatic-ring-hydroxylating dioxygenase subunit beta n=9 Tax=Escherichia coli TaxID=562 RepID=UPI0003D29E7B
EKRVFLVILFTSFSGSLVSRIPGAVQTDIPNVFAVRVNYLLYRAQKERDETFYVGTRFDKVRRLEDDNWRLLERDIVLDQAVITSHNLSVLF